MDEKRVLLRHFLAALAYRTQKALRDAPPEFADITPENLGPNQPPLGSPDKDWPERPIVATQPPAA